MPLLFAYGINSFCHDAAQLWSMILAQGYFVTSYINVCNACNKKKKKKMKNRTISNAYQIPPAGQ